MAQQTSDRCFSDVETWVFDLDNTLYPAKSELFKQVESRITDYVAEFLRLGREEAFRIQKEYFVEHGTTMKGLMHLHGMDPVPFLAYVHDIDFSVIPPAPDLDAVLTRLPGRKVVFTNADKIYGRKIMEQLGIESHFTDVFDIADAGFVPKPAPEVYDRMIEKFSIDPMRSILIDDLPRNLEPAAARGMTTVWLRTGSPWAQEGSDGDFIHHVADDLVAWLEEVAPPRIAPVC